MGSGVYVDVGPRTFQLALPPASLPVDERIQGKRDNDMTVWPFTPNRQPVLRTPLRWVLILEGNRPIRDAMRMLLDAAGYTTLAAAEVAEALILARERRGLEITVVSLPLPCATPLDQVLFVLRQIAGNGLKLVVLLDNAQAVPAEWRGDPRIRLARKPVEADTLLRMLAD